MASVAPNIIGPQIFVEFHSLQVGFVYSSSSIQLMSHSSNPAKLHTSGNHEAAASTLTDLGVALRNRAECSASHGSRRKSVLKSETYELVENKQLLSQ